MYIHIYIYIYIYILIKLIIIHPLWAWEFHPFKLRFRWSQNPPKSTMLVGGLGANRIL